MIGQKVRLPVRPCTHFVGVFFPQEARGGKAIADFNAFDGIDPHEGRGQIGVELAVNRRAPACGDVFGNDFDHSPDRGAGFTDAVEITLIELRHFSVRAEKRVIVDLLPIPSRTIHFMRAHLH